MEEKTNHNYSKVTKYKIQSKFGGIFNDEEDNPIKDISPIPLPQKQKIQTKGFAINNAKENLQSKKSQNKNISSQIPNKPVKSEKNQETHSKSEQHCELPIEYNPFPNLNQIPVKQYIPQMQISKEQKLNPKDNLSPNIEDIVVKQQERNKEIKGNKLPLPIPNRKKIATKNPINNRKLKEKHHHNLLDQKEKDFVESETNEKGKAQYYSEMDELAVEKVYFQEFEDPSKKEELSSNNKIFSNELEEPDNSSQKDKFVPYSLNDYKILKNENPLRLGGLGPNIGGKDWEGKMLQKNKVGQFAEEVRLLNKGLQPIKKARNTSLDVKRSEAKQKTDKAKDYAKKIPKPKMKKDASKGINDLKNLENLENLEEKHKQFNSEIEKIKQLIKE